MDLELEHAVKTALSKEDMLAGLNIRVSASNGEVSLSGVVRNQAQHNRAVKTAIGIAGVNVIDDKLAVTDQN
jgi:osmotically-inducible protein OsmY